jgi:N-acetylglucosaminyldiphosphoundecaprenol N-acetyl-beta-D-mannosaminyltransferase
MGNPSSGLGACCIDLFEELLDLAHRQQRRIYLLGARPDVLVALRTEINRRWPNAQIVGSHDGYFDDRQAAQIADHIRDTHPDMLFLGMPSPKKEVFLRRFQHALHVPVLHGVGGSFDVLAGITRRAPRLWQRMGLEWAYRLLQEPGRLWKRYLVTNSEFVALTLREIFRPSAELRQAQDLPMAPLSHLRTLE